MRQRTLGVRVIARTSRDFYFNLRYGAVNAGREYDTMILEPAFQYAPDTGGSGGSEGDSPKNEQPLTFTQAQLDALFAERAKRASEAAVNELLGKLGLKSTDEAVSVISEGRKLQESQMSEKEKLAAQFKALEEKAAKAEQDAQAVIASANERLLRASIKVEASARGFRPEAIDDVWSVINRSSITEKDGEFSGVKEAVEAVAKAKPFWLAENESKRGTPKPGDKKAPNADISKLVPQYRL